MRTGHRPRLRLLDRPLDRDRYEAPLYHPSALARPVLFVSGGSKNDRLLFHRVTRHWPGMELLVADTDNAAVAFAVARRPRMVVFGAGPSDRDRVNLVAELRTRVSASTPIVVLADDDSASQRARFIWAGASTYIVKPAHGCDVESTIGLLLEVASTR